MRSLEARRRAQRTQHFGQQAFGDGALRMLRGYEKSADESLVILEDVEAVSGGTSILHRCISAQRARLDELPDQDQWTGDSPIATRSRQRSASSRNRLSSDLEWSCRRSTICMEGRRAIPPVAL